MAELVALTMICTVAGGLAIAPPTWQWIGGVFAAWLFIMLVLALSEGPGAFDYGGFVLAAGAVIGGLFAVICLLVRRALPQNTVRILAGLVSFCATAAVTTYTFFMAYGA
ncbi:MAG: hypothetical protein ACRBCL_06205 [Maritimibacter sp.]